MKVYIAHPISGRTRNEVMEYIYETAAELHALNFTVLQPMTGKDELRVEKKYKAYGNDHPLATNHAIVRRDFWMVDQADIIYCNLMSADEVSIGCVAEIAWAYKDNKNIIISKPEEGPHHHAFVLEMASVLYPTHKEAMHYLALLAPRRRIG